MTTERPTRDTLETLRRALFVVLAASLLGIGVELLLVGHVEDTPQLIPLVLIGACLLAMGWHVLSRSAASVRVLRAVMLLTVVSGPVGMYLHYRGNAEFELEMVPGLGGLALFREAMTGATPALAPGTMMLLGALGLLYAWRHPADG